MQLIAKIDEKIKEAMRAQQKDALLALRNIKAFLKNKIIDLRRDLDASEEMQALATMCKQRQESIDSYQKANREDLVAKEKFELSIIQQFMPEPLSEEQLVSLISEVISEVDANGPQDMGKVMQALKPKVTGRADGKVVSQKVKEVLSAP
ncbi:MAG: GatB/YqeY domain-containing protein [Deltaproteobacteria bacterium]|nr:GatB/YqeY domain-containing protein [Deltaproteobacteria bacterium]